MDNDSITNMFQRAFFRFFVPGTVFTFFALLLPGLFLVKACDCKENEANKLINFLSQGIGYVGEQVILFALFAIGVGIILDLSKFQSFLTKISFFEKSSWLNMKIYIVEAFGIAVDKKRMDKKYESRIIELAFRIHSLYVKARYPKIDQKIEESRIYPDILSLGLFSILFGSFAVFVFLIFKRFFYSLSNEVGLVDFGEILWPWQIEQTLLSLLLLGGITLFIRSRCEPKTVKVKRGNFWERMKNVMGGLTLRFREHRCRGVCSVFIYFFIIVFTILSVYNIWLHFERNDLFLLIPFLTGAGIFLLGNSKVKEEFEKLNELTKSLIQEASCKKNEFIEFLGKEKFLLLEENENGYRVKEGGLKH